MSNAPAAFLIVPVLLLAWSEGVTRRIAVSVAAHAALWLPLPGMAVAYGVSPAEAWLGIPAVMVVQAVIVGLVPPALGVALWALSPFGFGHPAFGVFSLMPFQVLGVMGGLVTTAAILMGLAVRRTSCAALACLALLGMVNLVASDPPATSALVPVSTAFGERSVFPADDWSEIAVRVEETEEPGPRLLPEATIGRDADRGYRLFRDLARADGHDLFVGVSGDGAETIVRFSKDGLVDTVYRQVQGVPFINDGLAGPWRFVSPPAVIEGERVAFAICFEVFLPMTWARALMSRSGTVAVVSNDRWTSASVKVAQAKLLSFPWPATIVAAANSPEEPRND